MIFDDSMAWYGVWTRPLESSEKLPPVLFFFPALYLHVSKGDVYKKEKKRVKLSHFTKS